MMYDEARIIILMHYHEMKDTQTLNETIEDLIEMDINAFQIMACVRKDLKIRTSYSLDYEKI